MNPVKMTVQTLADQMGIPFSDEQIAAITAPAAPCVIIAGAGTGKTTVMAARVVWLVNHLGISANQVLGLTFTKKAVGELKDRVRSALSCTGVQDESEPAIMTYDSFATQVVGEFGAWAGISGKPRILNDAQRHILATQAVTADPIGPGLLADMSIPTLARKVLELENQIQSHLVCDEVIIEHTNRFLSELDQAPMNGKQPYALILETRIKAEQRLEILRLVQLYRQLKRKLGVSEFADQMASAVSLAQQVPDLSQQMRSEYKIVVVDEFQDTSPAQAQLLSRLFGASAGVEGYPITAVGDPLQAIYTWRGAAIDNIHTFHDLFPSSSRLSYPLSVNRRSGPEILDVANLVATKVRADPLVRSTLELHPVDQSQPAEVVAAQFQTWNQEAEWIADDLMAAHKAGLGWDQCAVLLRRNAEIDSIYQTLTRRGIPAVISNLSGLLSIEAISQVHATMKLIVEPRANPQVIEILTGPRFRITQPDLLLIGRRAKQLSSNRVTLLVNAVMDPGELDYSSHTRRCLDQLATDLRTLRSYQGDLINHVHAIISQIGLDCEVQASHTEVADHLSQFLAHVASFASTSFFPTLAGLVSYLDAEVEYSTGLSKANESVDDAVPIMTIHAAKGLEWDSVYLAGVVDRVFPDDRLRDNPLTTPSQLPTKLRSDACALPQIETVTYQGLNQYKELLRSVVSLSEDRLAYVAITRAKNRLVVTTHRWSDQAINPHQPSRYFNAAAEVAETLGNLTLIDQKQPPPLDRTVAIDWPIPSDSKWLRGARAVEDAIDGIKTWSDSEVNDEVRAEIARWDELIAALAKDGCKPDEVSVAIPSLLPAGGLTRMLRDPQGFAAQLVRPLPRPPSKSARRGSRFHDWVEHYYSQSPLPRNWQYQREDGFSKLQEAFLSGQFASGRPCSLESEFVMTISGQAITGRIDAVFRADQNPSLVPIGKQVLIVDWKTGSSHPDPLQLQIYARAWAVRDNLPLTKIAAGFYYVLSKQLVFVDIEDTISESKLNI